ncbi:MAG: C1 family peptidase [Bacteroidia bacterium]|nr:C1 family peptidase [Bacteroidia bacterium]
MKLHSIFIGIILGSLQLGHTQVLKNKPDSQIVFHIISKVNASPVADQANTSTCWSFSSLSFFESELARKGKTEVNLSEMFIVGHTYLQKADRYVRMHGNATFAPGGSFHDVVNVIRDIGIVPESVYPSILKVDNRLNHQEMDAVLKAIVDAVIRTVKNAKTSTTVWRSAFRAVLETYLGQLPESFEYNGKHYSPRSFADELGLNPDDYIEITSFTHRPFYKKMTLEVPDNWIWDANTYNIPLDELITCIDEALAAGYTIGWAADYSEKTFTHKNGLAILPEKDFSAMSESEKESLYIVPVEEKTITQEIRQVGFDNFTTQDEHAMHIIGSVRDQTGKKYYLVKNSWGTKSNEADGYLFASEAYVRAKTVVIMLNKNSLSKSLRRKLGI